MALVKDPLVVQLFTLAVRQNRIMIAIPGVGMVSMPECIGEELGRIAEAKLHVAWQIGMKYTQRNGRCLCGSGTKFKRCHGRAQ